METALDPETQDLPRPELAHPYLQALHAAGLTLDQILLQGELLELAPEELMRVAERLAPRASGDGLLAAHCLLLGTLLKWRPFVPAALRSGARLLEALLHPETSELCFLQQSLEPDRWQALRDRVLRRLDYALELPRLPDGRNLPARALPRLDRDRGLVLDRLELRRFASAAPAWRQLLVERLLLSDGDGPGRLGHAASGRWWYRPGPLRTTRLFRIARLRELEGLDRVSTLVAVHCPDLERLDAAPPVLVLKDCPSLTQVGARPRSQLLHLERCPRLAGFGAEAAGSSFVNLVLAHCPGLGDWPRRLQVEGRLVLRGMGPARRWPDDLRVGGDVRIQDCPGIEELPPMTVGGTLRVEGKSGLRRLAPGSVIGRHLDLRACAQLEGYPRGVKVLGHLYLPAHLHRPAPAEPLAEDPRDRYPELRALLLGLSFPDLSPAAARQGDRDRADAVLAGLRRELQDHPRLESELLWIASEAWQDLVEQRWADGRPWTGAWTAADGTLPLAWFRSLLAV